MRKMTSLNTVMSATFNTVNTQQTGIVPKIKYIHFTNIFALTAHPFLLCIFKFVCHFQEIRCLVIKVRSFTTDLSFKTEKRALTAVLLAQCLRISKITPMTLICTAKNWNNVINCSPSGLDRKTLPQVTSRGQVPTIYNPCWAGLWHQTRVWWNWVRKITLKKNNSTNL